MQMTPFSQLSEADQVIIPELGRARKQNSSQERAPAIRKSEGTVYDLRNSEVERLQKLNKAARANSHYNTYNHS